MKSVALRTAIALVATAGLVAFLTPNLNQNLAAYRTGAQSVLEAPAR